MQVGLSHMIGAIVTLLVLVAGAFGVGTQWKEEPEANTASVAASIEDDTATTSEEVDEEESTESEQELFDVIKVVDGDTIAVSMNGKSETIRLIGIDTPETNDPRTGVQCFGKEATAKLKSVIGTRVSIERDAGEGERDKYDRLLAYIYSEEGTMLNKYLIAQGYAYEYTYDDAYKYQKEFKAAQVDAKAKKRGLWASDACPPAQAGPDKSPVTKKAVPVSVPVATTPAVASSTQPTTTQAKKEQLKQEVQIQKDPEPEPPPKPKKADPEPEPEPAGDSTYTCSSNKYNCSHFKTQAEATHVFELCGGTDNDVHRLDGNKDGEVCETLP
ncbi:MAG: thermonuclease family protein [Minisyncoccia bacterium]